MIFTKSFVDSPLMACEAKYEMTGERVPQIKIAFKSEEQIFSYLQNRVNKGLTSVMVHQVEKTKSSTQSKSSILILRQMCRLISDPWKENLDVEISVRPNTGIVRTYKVDKKSLARQTLDVCFVGYASDLTVGDQINVTTSLDRPSEAQIGRTKEWLVQHGIGGEQSGFFWLLAVQ
ncbi:MAG: hypothetical protein NT027_18550 [Proteobacteria bacterium]|nr:hypothetical protein [Pseudomonadota bacterium]